MKVSELTNSNHDPCKVIQLPEGRLNAANAKSIQGLLEQQLKELATQTILVLDLSLLTFIDSIGIGTLVMFAKLCKQREVDLRFSGLQPQAKAAFEILELEQAFHFYENTESALEADTLPSAVQPSHL